MKIGVCVKVVSDTDTRIKIAGGGDGIDESGIKWIVSPYDTFAVEEGVKTKEAQKGEVVLFSAGPKAWQTQLRAGGLAVGGDRAVILDDPALASTDGLGIARALANRPALILADEPTGNLDPANAATALALLRETAAEIGAALLVVSHDTDVLARFDRCEAFDAIGRSRTPS